MRPDRAPVRATPALPWRRIASRGVPAVAVLVTGWFATRPLAHEWAPHLPPLVRDVVCAVYRVEPSAVFT